MKKKHYLLKILSQHSSCINGKERLGIECFSLEENGYYFGKTKSYYITNADLALLDIVTSDKTIDFQDKKIYRYPNIQLPRQKIDLLKTKFNIKIIRDPNLADIHIISDKLILDLITLKHHSSLSYVQMFDLFTYLKQNDLLTETGLNKCRDILSIVEKDAYINIISNTNTKYKIGGGINVIGPYIFNKILEYNSGNGRDIIINSDNIALYDQLFNKTALIVKDFEVNKIISKDLTTITEDEFDQILKMITSQDIDNRSLAIEMLANCNVEESFDIVSFLFFWYYDYFKDTKNWNNVNVKTLRKRFEAFSGNTSRSNTWTYDKYITLLINENKLTDFAVKKSINMMYESIIKNLFNSVNSAFSIDIESIYLLDKFKNLIIKKNV